MTSRSKVVVGIVVAVLVIGGVALGVAVATGGDDTSKPVATAKSTTSTTAAPTTAAPVPAP